MSHSSKKSVSLLPAPLLQNVHVCILDKYILDFRLIGNYFSIFV